MKLLNKDILVEYGFTKNLSKTTSSYIIMTRDDIDILVRDTYTFYYSNMGNDYRLKDLAALKKLYKELKNEELKIVNHISNSL